MPTYAYRCTNPECAHTFDAVQAFTDAALTECPVCGQPVRKVYGSVGVVFKGSGFYRNDSRAGGANGEKKESSSSSESGSSKSGSSDSGSSDSSSSAKSSDSGSSSSSSAASKSDSSGSSKSGSSSTGSSSASASSGSSSTPAKAS